MYHIIQKFLKKNKEFEGVYLHFYKDGRGEMEVEYMGEYYYFTEMGDSKLKAIMGDLAANLGILNVLKPKKKNRMAKSSQPKSVWEWDSNWSGGDDESWD